MSAAQRTIRRHPAQSEPEPEPEPEPVSGELLPEEPPPPQAANAKTLKMARLKVLNFMLPSL